MTTAAAAPVPTTQQLEQEIRELEKQNATLGPKLHADEEKLAALSVELAEAGEAIARGDTLAKGDGKHARVFQIKNEIDEIQIRANGAKSLIAKNNARITSIQPELNRRRDEAHQAQRIKARDELQSEGQKIANGIIEKLVPVMLNDMVQFEEIRARLAREFESLGGETIARNLVKLLKDPPDGVFKPIRERFNDWNRNGILIELCPLRPYKR